MLTGNIAAVIGFDQDTVTIKKTRIIYVADMNDVFSSVILMLRFPNHAKVSFLKLVNAEGKYGDILNNFRKLQYVPVRVKSFETIEIDKKGDKTENVKNNWTNYLNL